MSKNCIVCGKKLTQTNEVEYCMECYRKKYSVNEYFRKVGISVNNFEQWTNTRIYKDLKWLDEAYFKDDYDYEEYFKHLESIGKEYSEIMPSDWTAEEIVSELNSYLRSNGWQVDDKHGFIWKPEYWTFSHKQLAIEIAPDYCNMKDIPNSLRLEICLFFERLKINKE